MHPQRRLGEILVDLKVLQRLDVDRVLAVLRRSPRRKFGQVARAMGLVREEEVLAALAVQLQLFPGAERMSLAEVLYHLQAAPV